MPVLLATVGLALTSDYLSTQVNQWGGYFLQEGKFATAAGVGALSVAAYLSRSPGGAKHAVAKADVDKSKGGSLSEAFSITAGLIFILCSYLLVLSPEHKIRLASSRENPNYLSRVATFSPIQMASCVGLALCFVALITLAGMSLVPNASPSKITRADAWSVVALFLQALGLGAFLGIQLYRSAFYPGQTADSIVGLCWGLFFAGVGQVLMLAYHYVRREWGWWRAGRIQSSKASAPTSFLDETWRHVAKPSSLAMIGAYLVLSWVFCLLPDSYYDETSKVEWVHVLLQLLAVDMFMYFNHRAEHALSALYVASHKPHHKFTSPTMFDAFDGSVLDTLCLIVLPLFATGQLVSVCSTWSYIAFGFVYSTHFMLIHAEWAHVGDELASKLGVYITRDHHVHHSRFVYNYAHFFTVFDRVMGTYREVV